MNNSRLMIKNTRKSSSTKTGSLASRDFPEKRLILVKVRRLFIQIKPWLRNCGVVVIRELD